MKQATMQDLIIQCMKNMNSTKLSTAYLIYIARGVMENCKLDKIAFSATTEHIFRTVFNNQQIFKISLGGDGIELVHPEKLKQYIEESIIDSEVMAAINKHIGDFEQPHFPALVCENFAEEREGYILSVIFHIEWLLDMVERYNEFKSCDYHLAGKSSDLENLTIMQDLYKVVSMYSEQYLISCSNYATQSYKIAWGGSGNMRVAELHKLQIEGATVIQAVKVAEYNDAVNYANIVFWQEDKDFRKKKKMLDIVEQILADAKSNGLPYKHIKDIINKLYNIQPNESNN